MDLLGRQTGTACCAAALVVSLTLGAPSALCWLLGAACGLSVAGNLLAAGRETRPECDVGICRREELEERPADEIAPERCFALRLEEARAEVAVRERTSRGR